MGSAIADLTYITEMWYNFYIRTFLPLEGTMTERPVVEITEVSIDPIRKNIVDIRGVPIRVDLGEATISQAVNGLLEEIRRKPSRLFMLRWRDSRVPSGAEVVGQKIAWTQHGIVYAEGGKMIGVYERLSDTLENQVMLVQIFIEDIKPAPNQNRLKGRK